MQIGSPIAVFEGQYFATPGTARQHHVAPDGRFLMMKDAAADGSDGQMPTQVVLVLNWHQELLERIPVP